MILNVKLRKFSLLDLKAILEIEQFSFATDAYPKNRFVSLYKKHLENFIVAELQNKIVGYIAAYSKGNFVDIDSMAVDKKYRNLGIGKKLLNFILDKFKREGFKKASLEVRTTNKIAASFYQALGFKIRKIIKNYYRDGGDAYRMEKDLIV